MSSAEQHIETMILGTFPKRARAMEDPKDEVTHDPIMIPAEQYAVKALLHEIKSKMQGSTDEDKLFTFCGRSQCLTKHIPSVRFLNVTEKRLNLMSGTQ